MRNRTRSKLSVICMQKYMKEKGKKWDRDDQAKIAPLPDATNTG